MIAGIGERLRTQDNGCTRDPMFVVQQRKRLYVPADEDHPHVWVDTDSVEASPDEAIAMDAVYDASFDDAPDGWRRCGFIDTWEFVSVFFTRAAAEAFIATNKHRLTDPQIYIDSAYRNAEWQAVREHLMGLEAPTTTGPICCGDPMPVSGYACGDRLSSNTAESFPRAQCQSCADKQAAIAKLEGR